MSGSVLETKALAYFDSFAGLVPCKVLSLTLPDTVRVRVTATRGAYKCGDIFESTTRYIIPRRAIFVRNGQYRISHYEGRIQT